eukprot:6214830-Pleurochrysis_carterae.AAC.4
MEGGLLARRWFCGTFATVQISPLEQTTRKNATEIQAKERTDQSIGSAMSSLCSRLYSTVPGVFGRKAQCRSAVHCHKPEHAVHSKKDSLGATSLARCEGAGASDDKLMHRLCVSMGASSTMRKLRSSADLNGVRPDQDCGVT